MGVDCSIALPGNVRVRDVADVLGKLRGAESSLEKLGRDSYQVVVADVEVKGIAFLAACADIRVTGPRPGPQYCFFHFASEGSTRAIRLSSTPANIAIAKRLVEFFGGAVDFNDCDDIDCDFEVQAKTDTENQPSTGVPWKDLQQRIHAVEAITDEEIDAVREYAYSGR
jgi:hypothetical protein